MKKYLILFSLYLSTGILFSFAQEKPTPVIINKQIEVVEYDCQYVLVEFLSSIKFSTYYPLLTIAEPSVGQQFFEEGRNIRPGYEIGFEQGFTFGSWAISSGVYYLNYNEYFSYHEYPTRQVTIQEMDGTQRIIQVADGEPLLYSRYNRLDYLKVPLCLSYCPLRLEGKLWFNLELNYHYLLASDYMAKFSIIEPVMTLPKSAFNSSFYSMSASVLYHQKIYKRINSTIEPYFNLGLGNLVYKEYLTFGMDAIGIRLGFSFFY